MPRAQSLGTDKSSTQQRPAGPFRPHHPAPSVQAPSVQAPSQAERERDDAEAAAAWLAAVNENPHIFSAPMGVSGKRNKSSKRKPKKRRTLLKRRKKRTHRRR